MRRALVLAVLLVVPLIWVGAALAGTPVPTTTTTTTSTTPPKPQILCISGFVLTPDGSQCIPSPVVAGPNFTG